MEQVTNRIKQFLSFLVHHYLRPLLSYTASHTPDLVKLFTIIVDSLFSIHLIISCNMLPCTIDLEDSHEDVNGTRTTVHVWIPSHRKANKPALVLLHGFGGNSKWQFHAQVRHLSKNFNLYIPDLVFFGGSHSNRSERSIEFQAQCIGVALRRVGVQRYSVAGLSYGGYVAHRMAEVSEAEVEKVVIISSGICQGKEEREEQLKKVGTGDRIHDLLLPQKAEDVRKMLKVAMFKPNRIHLAPDFILNGLIKAIGNKHKKEKLELVDHLMNKQDSNPAIINQDTLLIWGENDKVFPLHLAYKLQSHLGPKSRVEVLKQTGHGVNIDSPDEVNRLITSFILSERG